MTKLFTENFSNQSNATLVETLMKIKTGTTKGKLAYSKMHQIWLGVQIVRQKLE